MTNFLRNKSSNFHENCTPSSMAHNTKLQKNLTKRQIYHYAIAMTSVMFRSFGRICNAIFCYYYLQFYREGDS